MTGLEFPTTAALDARPRRAVLGWLVGVLLAGLLNGPPGATATDRIILRKLEVITDRTVVSFDEDGVVLDDARLLTWDEIEKATVATRQQEFDAMLKELGVPLYRLRQRLTVGDYAGLAAPADAVFARYATRRGRAACLVFQALMWSRLASGQREAAVEPYLLVVECWRAVPNPKEALTVPGDRQLAWDPATALCDELVPIWFDAESARRVLPQVGATIGAMRTPWPPGARIYYASLAAAAGESDRMHVALQELDDAQWRPWQDIVRAQAEFAAGLPGPAWERIEANVPAERGMDRALALYLAGRGAVRQTPPDRRRDGMLTLLRVPAAYGPTYPELAAAALYETMQTLTDLQEIPASVAVRGELLDKFATTHFAKLVQDPTEPRRK